MTAKMWVSSSGKTTAIDIRLAFNSLPWARFQELLFGKKALSHYNEIGHETINKISGEIIGPFGYPHSSSFMQGAIWEGKRSFAWQIDTSLWHSHLKKIVWREYTPFSHPASNEAGSTSWTEGHLPYHLHHRNYMRQTSPSARKVEISNARSTFSVRIADGRVYMIPSLF